MGVRSTDYVRLAFRNMVNQRSRSVLAILAIVIATTSVTILVALVTGTKNFYYDQFKATDKLSQVVVNPQPGLSFEQAEQGSPCQSCNKLTNGLAKQISSMNHVVGISPTTNVNVFESVKLDGHKQTVHGAKAYAPNGIIKHIFVAGKDFNSGSGAGKIIIGQNYADKWGYKHKYHDIIGKQVEFTTGSDFTGEGATLPKPLIQFKKCQKGCQADEIAGQQKPSTLKATIVGVESDDSTGLFVPLKWAQGLLKNRFYEITKPDQAKYIQAYTAWKYGGQKGAEPTPHFTLASDSLLARNGYSTLVIKVDNPDNAEAVAKQIRRLGIGAVTANSYVNDQLQVFNVISFILAGIGSIALVVAAIGIVNTMVMAVLERTREIGIIRAIGGRRSTVRRLFTVEASMLGFLGGAIGIALGWGFILLANVFINEQLATNAVTGRNIIHLPIWLVFAVVGSTTLIGMLAGLYPANRAAKLNPVEALRHE
jgi:ABC-type antimicrobial peptide transport system permease subunit